MKNPYGAPKTSKTKAENQVFSALSSYPLIQNAKSAEMFWREHVAKADWFDSDCETLVVLLLNARKKVTGFARVASGTLNVILCSPREVFKHAIVRAAGGILIMHNHPSGDSSPSDADIKVTRKMIAAGRLIEIEVLDHVIVGDVTGATKGYSSLRHLGYFF